MRKSRGAHLPPPERVFALDVSSSIVGWSVIDFTEDSAKLIAYGHIKPKVGKLGDTEESLALLKQSLKVEIDKWDPEFFAIENYAKNFFGGKTNANAIIKLALYNETVCLFIYEQYGVRTFKFPVQTIRATISKIYKVKLTSKAEAFEEIVKNSSLKLDLKKTGKIKDYWYDMVDAIAVGLTYGFKNGGWDGQNYSIQ